MTALSTEQQILAFELVKKFSKNNVTGLELRSFKAENDNCRVVVNSPKTEQYADIKEKIAQYRDLTGHKMNFKGVGKSLEITTADDEAASVMMDFLKGINFVNEDVNDFIVFYNDYLGFGEQQPKLGEVLSAELGKDAGKITVQTSLELQENAAELDLTKADEGLAQNEDFVQELDEEALQEAADKVFEAMDEVLTRYNIGVVKYLQKAWIGL